MGFIQARARLQTKFTTVKIQNSYLMQFSKWYFLNPLHAKTELSVVLFQFGW